MPREWHTLCIKKWYKHTCKNWPETPCTETTVGVTAEDAKVFTPGAPGAVCWLCTVLSVDATAVTWCWPDWWWMGRKFCSCDSVMTWGCCCCGTAAGLGMVRVSLATCAWPATTVAPPSACCCACSCWRTAAFKTLIWGACCCKASCWGTPPSWGCCSWDEDVPILLHVAARRARGDGWIS